MMQQNQEDVELLLNRVRFILEEGQPERAREVLKRICPENEEQQEEIKYFQAWSYIQDESWDEADHLLTPLVQRVELDEETDDLNLRNRLRRALYLFQLGNTAVNLYHYDDASRHYAKCLKLLQDRRFQLPPKVGIIRVRARYSLGMTCIERGLYPAAKQHYEAALKMYTELFEGPPAVWKEDLGHIYYGLCDLYRKSGSSIDALEMGKKALSIYDDLREPLLKGRVDNLLGHIYMQLGEFHDASDHFTASLATATTYNRPAMVMINCSALAKLRMTEGRLKEAMDYSKLAMEWMDRLNNEHLTGMAYLTTGLVTRANASQLQGEERRSLMEDALSHFEQACEHLNKTQAYDKVSEAQGRRAETLEMLGRTQEALACWNSAYKAQADSFGPPLF